MNITFMKHGLFLALAMALSMGLQSQNTKDEATTNEVTKESKIKLNVGADIMSRYIWRGTDYGHSPSIQPTLSLTAGGFEIGGWGAIATNSFYQEIDLYAKYTLKNFSVILTDYYIPSVTGTSSSPDSSYFNYTDDETAHSLEVFLALQRW